MGAMWRAIDTGLRSAAQNIALSRALLEARQADEIPSTLRFMRYTASALLASRDSPAQEFDAGYCESAGIALQRRITDGDAVCCDKRQLGWELLLHRQDVGAADMAAIAKRIGHAAATAISALGADARYRPRHDIEIDGRVVACGGGAHDGSALLYQGIVLLEYDAAKMRRALRMPATPWLAGEQRAAHERMIGLKTVLGAGADSVRLKSNMTAAFESEFAVEFQDGDLSLTEHVRYRRALAEVETPGWVNLVQQATGDQPLCVAAHQTAGGLLHASVIYDRAASRIRRVRFSDDLDIRPWRTLPDLEAALRDTAVDRLAHNVRAFFAGRKIMMPAAAPEDFVAVVQRALALPIIAHNR